MNNDLKLFLCTWGTNYGLGCCVIAANSLEEANTIAKSDTTGLIWDSFENNEIITPKETGIIPINFYNHY